MLREFNLFNGNLSEIKSPKKLITTLNAHSFNMAHNDPLFREALHSSDILLPDGISIVLAKRLITGERLKKIAGYDLFHSEMQYAAQKGGKCFFLGSSPKTLELIMKKARKEYPSLQVYGYSPPFKKEFEDEDSQSMVEAVNKIEPDVLFIGMTAPKQEKWSFKHYPLLNAGHVCCIGAVFDFYAGTVKRAPKWMIASGMEWTYRLLREPRRMWQRYLIGNTLFVMYILKEKFQADKKKLDID